MIEKPNLNVNSITILICTYNGKNKLEGTINSIAELIVPEGLSLVELLIIDNNSNDGTNEMLGTLKEYVGEHIRLRTLIEARPGKSNALITGFNNAKGDIVILCDDDNHLDKEYLNLAYNLFKSNRDVGLAGGFGRKALFTDGVEPEWFDTFSQYFVVGTHHPHSRILAKGDYSVYGAGSVLRKTAWNKIYNSGFRFQNSTYQGRAFSEDVELSMAVAFSGYKLYFDNQLTFTHDLRWGRMTFDNLLEQERLNGKGHVYLVVYEILFHRIRSKFLWARFIKDYFLYYSQLKKEIKHLARIPKTEKTTVDKAKKDSMLKYMLLLFPVILFRFNFYKNWIYKVTVAK